MRKRYIIIVSLILLLLAVLGLSACISPNNTTNGTGSNTTENGAVNNTSNTEHNGKRVYFAAPLFSEAERDYNLKIVHILESYGYEVFLPQRDGFLATELENMTEQEKSDKIFKKDLEEVLKADILFAVLDGRAPDEGVCVELGIAYANGKRCYGMKTDARSVEYDMDINPMIMGCFNHYFYNLDGDELIKSLEDYLKNNQL